MSKRARIEKTKRTMLLEICASTSPFAKRSASSFALRSLAASFSSTTCHVSLSPSMRRRRTITHFYSTSRLDEIL